MCGSGDTDAPNTEPLLSQHATSVCGEPSAPTLDATCGTERVGRIRPAGGRPGRPAVLVEARRPNREPPPGARARRGVSHKTWPRSGILSQATVEPERRGWGPAALQATYERRREADRRARPTQATMSEPRAAKPHKTRDRFSGLSFS